MSPSGARYDFKHLKTAELLLRKGTNPDHRHWKGFTLLHDFAFEGDVDKCRLLIEHGADSTIVDEEYNLTPLGYARHFGRDEVAEWFFRSLLV